MSNKLPNYEEQPIVIDGRKVGEYAYSRCDGRRKALIIGINYTQSAETTLTHSVSDAIELTTFLEEHHGFDRENIVLLTDEPGIEPLRQATRFNMVNAMHWLVKDARMNDSLFFYFSGHSGEIADNNGDEHDGLDEVILPMDYSARDSNHIVDDDMHDWMVQGLPRGARLTAIFDSYNSGTALDLPWIYDTDGNKKEPALKGSLWKDLKTARKESTFLKGTIDALSKYNKKKDIVKNAYIRKNAMADVVMISVTKDNEIT